MKNTFPSAVITLFILATSIASAGQIVIDDFGGYATTAELQQSWNSFGSAASSGPPTLAPNKGTSDTNAALFQLNWDAGDNANMRLLSLDADKQDLSDCQTVQITLKLADDAQGHSQPSSQTALRIVIKGGPDGSIWQTDSDIMPTVSPGTYLTVTIPVTDETMIRDSGHSSLQQTLSQVTDLRIRFENQQTAGTRQDAYVDQLIFTE